MTDSWREHREDLARYGMDRDPWGRDEEDAALMARRLFRYRYAEAMHPFVADGSWGEAADDEDGEA